jgi:transmembrane sensor
MSELRFPLKDYLEDRGDEAVVCRMALAIDERLERRRRRRFVPFVLVGAATAAAVLVAVTSSHLRRDKGPLLLADGREIVAMDATRAGREIDLSDGSRIWLAPGAGIEPLQSTGVSFSAVVTRGRADFDVRPGGPRHWIVECGLATVEVVGTAFACEREHGRLRVVVRHGVVLVRGERVPNRARRLAAGETLEITDTAEAPASGVAGPGVPAEAPAKTGPSELPGAETGPAGTKREPVKDARPAAWRALARHGRHNEAFASLGTEGLRRESERLGVHDLLALADVARLSGHPAEAVRPLERILVEFARDSQAPLAAFALGRVELDSLGHARAATSAFRKALALGIPRGLREDVLARLVEACARSGDADAARQAAAAYGAEFPGGRHAHTIQRWLQPR